MTTTADLDHGPGTGVSGLRDLDRAARALDAGGLGAAQRGPRGRPGCWPRRCTGGGPAPGHRAAPGRGVPDRHPPRTPGPRPRPGRRRSRSPGAGHPGGRAVRGGGAWPPPWTCRFPPGCTWSARASSCASGCPGSGRRSTTAGSRRPGKARQVARATTGLSPASVGFVDRHLAVTGRHNRIPALNPGRCTQARLQCCTPTRRPRWSSWRSSTAGVSGLDHHDPTAASPAVATMTARLDMLDALDLDGSLADLAATLGRLGDQPAAGPAPRRRPRRCSPTRDASWPSWPPRCQHLRERQPSR